jgi:hypothetical protein
MTRWTWVFHLNLAKVKAQEWKLLYKC